MKKTQLKGGKKQVNCHLSAPMHKALRIAALMEDMTMQEFVEKAISTAVVRFRAQQSTVGG